MTEEADHTHSSVDVRTVTAPILTIVSLAGFLIWATTSFWQQKQELIDTFETRIEEVEKTNFKLHDKITETDQMASGRIGQLEEIVKRQTEVIAIIRSRQKFVLENLWSKKNHGLWCAEMEKKNSGFKCLDYNTMNELGLLGTYEQYGINSMNLNDLLDTLDTELKGGLWDEKHNKHTTR